MVKCHIISVTIYFAKITSIIYWYQWLSDIERQSSGLVETL